MKHIFSSIQIVGLPICILLLYGSCRKDPVAESEIPLDQVKVAEIITSRATSSPSLPSATFTYTFGYDGEGRINRVNDRHFYYGEDGRVAFSRIHHVERSRDDISMEHIERLRYEWDTQGRIYQIIVDSLYKRRFDARGTTIVESFGSGLVAASFNYVGGTRLPSSIDFVSDYEHAGANDPYRQIIYYTYEGDNVTYSKQAFVQVSALPPESPNYNLYTVHNWFGYTDKPSHLLSAYRQLGFHPYEFFQVVAANTINRSYSELHQGETPIPTEPDWEKATSYRTTDTDWGYPARIETEFEMQGVLYKSYTEITYQDISF